VESRESMSSDSTRVANRGGRPPDLSQAALEQGGHAEPVFHDPCAHIPHDRKPMM
jgi:hypothetical protein